MRVCSLSNADFNVSTQLLADVSLVIHTCYLASSCPQPSEIDVFNLTWSEEAVATQVRLVIASSRSLPWASGAAGISTLVGGLGGIPEGRREVTGRVRRRRNQRKEALLEVLKSQ